MRESCVKTGWPFWTASVLERDDVEPAAGTFERISEYLEGRAPRPTAERTASGVRATKDVLWA
jgi:hypothetical protein